MPRIHPMCAAMSTASHRFLTTFPTEFAKAVAAIHHPKPDTLPPCYKCGHDPMVRETGAMLSFRTWVECTGCPSRTPPVQSGIVAYRQWKQLNSPAAGESAPQPAESPDDWVTQNRVPLRKIDEFRYVFASGRVGGWCTGSGAEDSTIVHNAVDDAGDRIEIRCRRKDLPVVPHHVACSGDRSKPIGSSGCSCPTLDGVPVTGSACPQHGFETGNLNVPADKPRMMRVVLREYKLGVSSEKHWTTSDSYDSWATGRTAVVEVPE